MFSSIDLGRSMAINAIMYLLNDHRNKNGNVLQTFLLLQQPPSPKQTNNKSDN